MKAVHLSSLGHAKVSPGELSLTKSTFQLSAFPGLDDGSSHARGAGGTGIMDKRWMMNGHFVPRVKVRSLLLIVSAKTFITLN